MAALVAAGLLLAVAGWVGIYLASPHQRWRGQSWPARPARWAGSALLAAGLAVLCRPLHAVTAVYVFVTWGMLWLALMPYLGALLRRN